MPRPRTPTALKLIRGNPGKRPIPEGEPTPAGAPVKPKWLKGRAGRIWAETAPKLFWLTEVDSEKLAVWCGIYAEIQADLGHVNTARIQQWRVLGGELGMDPVARSKMAQPKQKKSDPADKYF